MKEPLRVVLVENDHLTQEDAIEDLQKYLNSQVTTYSAESDFRNSLDSFRNSPPDIFIFGLWVRWTHPAPVMPEAPIEVLEGEYNHHYGAGMRMARLIAEDPRTANTPVVIWDCLDEEELKAPFKNQIPFNVHFLTRLSAQENFIKGLRAILENRY